MSKNPYERRDRDLLALGFTSYSQYLASPLWWDVIRPAVLERAGGLCEACGNTAILVHHNSYTRDVLLGVNLKPLIALCRGCHDYAEHDEDGRKVPLWLVRVRLRRIVRTVKEDLRLAEVA